MDKKIERSNKDKVLRRLGKSLKVLGFIRSKPTFFVRVNGHVVEFIHIHKYTFGPTFRVHVCLRVINDPRDFIALLGISSDQYGRLNSPNEKKYNFSYHKTEESLQRCVENINQFVEEVAEPWFKKWEDYDALLNGDDSPLQEDERVALRASINGQANPEREELTRALLKMS